MELPDFSSMSHVIPPILSDTPPPLDLLVDEIDDDDGFGDFGVASDLGFDLSDSTAGSDEYKEPTINLPEEERVHISPTTSSELKLEAISEVIISPQIDSDSAKPEKCSVETSNLSEENSIDNFNDSDFSKNSIKPEIFPPSEHDRIDIVNEEKVSDEPFIFEDKNTNSSFINDSDISTNDNKEEIFPPTIEERTDIAVGGQCSNDADGFEIDLVSNDFENDPLDITEELNRISNSPDFSSCDVELDVRTSPEGADDNCVSENVVLCDFPIPSITNPCEFNTKDSIDVDINETLSSSKSEFEEEEDGFTDFADFSSQPFPQDSEISNSNDITQDKDPVETAEAENDFDDFDDFESAAPPLPTFDAEPNSGENISKKLKTIFGNDGDDLSAPNADPRLTECLHSCLDDSSSVWGNLKDLEASFALSLQWNSSSASRRLLSSISVDSRNILVGQRWNPSMPRFAANIGCTPLEPMKAPADDASPVVCEAIPNVLPPVSEDVVPAAQFDWNSSGLTNPLDCLEKEEAAIVGNPTELILEERNDASNSVESPLTDLWSKADIPVTDILLPTPKDPSPSTLDITTTASHSNKLNDDWMQHMALSPMPTISSNLEKIETKEDILTCDVVSNGINIIEEPKQKMSTEAYRVVDTLPDLSFLSARKLLYAANANMARFQASARP